MIHSTNKMLLEAFVGCVYYSHPYHAPENIDKILEHLEKFAQHKSSEKEHIEDLWCFSFENPCQFRKELSEWMMGCLEYRQLNISRKLKDQV